MSGTFAVGDQVIVRSGARQYAFDRIERETATRDLGMLNENTSTGEYGYTQDEDGTLFVQVWNDSYHGTKQTYRVRIALEPA